MTIESQRSPAERRQFLKATAMAGAGVWLASPSPGAETKSPNAKLNIGIIGAGGKGEANISGVSSENIVAICDVDDLRAAKAYERFPKAQRHHDFRKMLDAEKGLDAVVISTPDHTHAPAALMAMKLGKHVYCEKPLAHSISEARLLAQVAGETKVATQMGNQNHSGSGYRQVVELVWSGAIGQVREAHAWSNRPIWPQGIERPQETMAIPASLEWDLWLGPAPQRPYHSAYAPFKWRGWWDFGTGALGDMGCHIIDPIVWALKLGSPSRVEAESAPTTAETGPKWEVIRYDFPARGESPPVKLTWWDGGKRPPAELAHGETIPGNGLLLIGDKGTLLCAHSEGPRLLPHDRFADFKLTKSLLPPTLGHYRDWIEASKGAGAASSNFAYAGPLTETVLLGNLAVRLGRPIAWDAEKMRAIDCPEADALVRREYRDGWGL